MIVFAASAAIVLIIYLIREWYRRYIPVRNIPCLSVKRMDGFPIVDVRDFNNRHAITLDQSMNIPYSYLQKTFNDINAQEIYLIAATKLERNMSIRFLKRKGILVKGYALSDEKECNGKSRLDTMHM
ncbi:sulfurtransferase [Metabacillus sp. KIGAM252]|uniref:Sulfurtransferase n=1 Tax=Metabacillus flavus TaxID=2823519 RepID=A0ABS5LCX1_9BACI|nr:sulfurtransferase [Metabacillus flavus]MBS2968593.1 sulfurtransferase [Metabacillus flavus]